jgi:MFS transporter, DHA1 family, solute carrier family 18 (vesicular amine transporter), member 1/2
MTTLRRSRGVAVALVTFATFTDIVAYSIAVPVLPDLSRRLGASPTMIGLLFASFGVTLLTVSAPMGAVSDRVGRRAPMVGGLVALSAATLLFAFSSGLPWLFAARLVQGAADAVTWVVGFALIADLYGSDERGRVMGMVLAGTNFAFMFGPTLGGWLYEAGGIRLPFLVVSALAIFGAVAFLWLDLPQKHADREVVPIGTVLRDPAVAACVAAVIAASATISMLEPVLPLFLFSTLGLGPARIGLVFGVGAVVSTLVHPVYGRMADRFGGRPLTMIGLVLVACVLPVLSRAWSYESAIAFYVLEAATVALVITPSLTYMAEATSNAGLGSFGVGYGLYNMAWGAGLLCGPALGGFLFDRMGFPRMALFWAPCVVSITIVLGRVKSKLPKGGPI